MKAALIRAWFWVFLSSLIIFRDAGAGTWNDHFSEGVLRNEWTGIRDAFQIVQSELRGVSASPITVSPFQFVEIQTDSADCSVGVWVNVVAPNAHVCTKGALVLRHTGAEGYVFALHEATQTAEVYRLSNHEMLLSKSWKIDLQKWYYIRAELHGPTMTFYVSDELVGSVMDAASASGAVGLAVQDAESVLFDDFTITGPNVIGNVDDVAKPEVTTALDTSGQVVLRFTASPPYNYFVQANSIATPSHEWETIATFQAKVDSFEAVVTDSNTNEVRFYRIEKVPCGCR